MTFVLVLFEYVTSSGWIILKCYIVRLWRWTYPNVDEQSSDQATSKASGPPLFRKQARKAQR